MVKLKEQSIALRNAGLGYNGRAILDSIELEIRPGDVVCLLGQNGAGKTTTFYMIVGFLAPVYGSVTLAGREVSRLSPREIARIVSYVPQSYAMPFAYSVTDVVLFGRSARIGLFASPGRADRRIAAECLDLLGIAHLAGRAFNELSGGERQMVILARALAQEARFMILDEPASNLDYGNQVLLLRKVQELVREGIGIVMATHAPEQALHLGARVVTLEERRAVAWPHAREALVPEVMKRVYGVEIDMISTEDSRGNPLRIFSPLQP